MRVAPVPGCWRRMALSARSAAARDGCSWPFESTVGFGAGGCWPGADCPAATALRGATCCAAPPALAAASARLAARLLICTGAPSAVVAVAAAVAGGAAAVLHMEKEDLIEDFLIAYNEALSEIGFSSRDIARMAAAALAL